MAKRAQENEHADTNERVAVAETPPTHGQDPLLNLSEVARQLGKSPNTIKNWVFDGLLRAQRMPSGMICVRKSEVNRFLGGSALQKQVS